LNEGSRERIAWDEKCMKRQFYGKRVAWRKEGFADGELEGDKTEYKYL